MQFPDIKVGKLMMIKGFPCRIVEVKFSKPGRHGPGKKSVTGLDIVTGKKHVKIYNHRSQIEVPELERITYEGSGIDDDGYVTLIDDEGSTREDLQLLDQDMIEAAWRRFNNDELFEVTVASVRFEEKGRERLEEIVLSVK